MDEIKQLDQTYIAPTYARFDLQIVKGSGATITDAAGKTYIDFGSGIGVTALGASDPGWKQAVIDQLEQIQHTSNLYYTRPQALLAKELCERTGMKRVFFSNSGAEANECAMKAARKYSHDKYGPERSVIITLINSFHGRTVTTLSATGQESFHQHFGPFTPGFKYVEANNIDALEQAMDETVCAVMLELIQGEGGVNALRRDYVKQLFQLAKKKDILTIVDEVQTGNGRTGALYCYMNYGVTPDIVSTAKGLAGGLPFGATLFGDAVEQTLRCGDHGSTFGGNPVCAAAARYVLSRLDETLLEAVKEKSERIKAQLETTPNVLSVSGMGLMLGVKTIKSAKEVANQCLERGLMVLTAKDKIRLLPPLTITQKELEEGLHILKEVLAQ